MAVEFTDEPDAATGEVAAGEVVAGEVAGRVAAGDVEELIAVAEGMGVTAEAARRGFGSVVAKSELAGVSRDQPALTLGGYRRSPPYFPTRGRVALGQEGEVVNAHARLTAVVGGLTEDESVRSALQSADAVGEGQDAQRLSLCISGPSSESSPAIDLSQSPLGNASPIPPLPLNRSVGVRQPAEEPPMRVGAIAVDGRSRPCRMEGVSGVRFIGEQRGRTCERQRGLTCRGTCNG